MRSREPTYHRASLTLAKTLTETTRGFGGLVIRVWGAKCAVVERFIVGKQRKSPDQAVQDDSAVAKRLTKTAGDQPRSLRQKTVHGGLNAPPFSDDLIHELEYESFAAMDTVLVPRASAALLL